MTERKIIDPRVRADEEIFQRMMARLRATPPEHLRKQFEAQHQAMEKRQKDTDRLVRRANRAIMGGSFSGAIFFSIVASALWSANLEFIAVATVVGAFFGAVLGWETTKF